MRKKSILAFSLCITFVPIVVAQDHQGGRIPITGPVRSRAAEISELEKDNLSHVAASSVQIREVLVNNAGLLVELKSWIAKEAADNGQVVKDSDLTDQAVFDRLDNDVRFRSVATHLLQRYGYLLPSQNPDSTLGKEQQLVLQERARRLVQIEAQEDTQSLTPKINQEQESEPTDCGPDDDSCVKARTRRRTTERQIENEQQPVPEGVPRLSSEQSRTLRANYLDDFSPRDVMSQPRPELEPASLNAPDDLRQSHSNSPSTDQLRPGQGPLPDQADTRENIASLTGNEVSALSNFRRRKPIEQDGDANPAKIGHSVNPFADVPSLYDMYIQPAAWQRPAERFGVDVFRSSAARTDIIPMDLPVGPDYIVGPGDSLAVDLWGSVSQRFVRLVDREGRVPLPDTAPLLVSGKSLGQIQLDIQHALRSAFRDVSADVSVSRLRTVRVYVVGEVAEPGAYDISSLSTPLNALIAAGGITPRGSLRGLRHFRGKELIEQVDAYDLLLHGIRSDLKRLESGDTLQVPPVGPQVTIDGMVRRPAIYELSHETSLADALDLAGGILPTGALRHVEVQRIEAHEKRSMLTLDLTGQDLDAVNQQMQKFQVRDGDQVHIFPIAAYNEDAIYLQGHVLRPGRYSYKQGMKLTDLISSYGDMLPEPAPHYAEIVRLNPPDFHPTVESFDIATALANPASAPALKPLDTVRIFSRYDFEAPPQVLVGGEVRKPGAYRTSGQAHLRDAVYLAGGITPDAALDTAQLFRTQPDGTMKILSVNLGEALSGNPVDNIILQSRDRLLIHRTFEKVEAPTVDIRGEVSKPGRYPLTANMHVEDLVRVAGGLKRSAFADGADLTRFVAGGGANQHVEINLSSVLSGNANDNLALRNGDVLTIRQIPQWNDLGASVTVKGEVQHPATYGIEPGETLSSLLSRCNGFTAQAYPYGAVLIRKEVRDLQMRSHLELVTRIKNEERYLQSMPEADADQKNVKLTAISQTETVLAQLEATAPVGRVVIHIPDDLRKLPKTAADIPLRDGDVLVVPKKANYVMVSGQVFNPTAVSYLPGKSARFYLSQAGGVTQVADKKAVFVIRGDGSVLSAKNNSGLWSGDPLNAVLKPGDSIVVPEKAPKIAGRNWAPLLQTAQVASSVALAVAYIH